MDDLSFPVTTVIHSLLEYCEWPMKHASWKVPHLLNHRFVTPDMTCEENLRSAQSALNYQHIDQTCALLCVHPKNICLKFAHSATLNSYNNVADLEL